MLRLPQALRISGTSSVMRARPTRAAVAKRVTPSCGPIPVIVAPSLSASDDAPSFC